MPTPPSREFIKSQIKLHMSSKVEVIVIAVLLVISLAHLMRLLTGVEIVIGGTTLPLWTSLLGFLGSAVLAGLFWWSHR